MNSAPPSAGIRPQPTVRPLAVRIWEQKEYETQLGKRCLTCTGARSSTDDALRSCLRDLPFPAAPVLEGASCRPPASTMRDGADRVLCQPLGIENQRHCSVAQNGRAGDQLNLPVEPAQVLDH